MKFVKDGLMFTGENTPLATLLLSVMKAYRGRKKALGAEAVAELRRRVAAGETKAQVARELDISRETLYQYLCATT